MKDTSPSMVKLKVEFEITGVPRTQPMVQEHRPAFSAPKTLNCAHQSLKVKLVLENSFYYTCPSVIVAL